MASSGSGEERTWLSRKEWLHLTALLSEAGCEECNSIFPKLRAAEKVRRAEREAREKATARIADLTDERDGLISKSLRLEEDAEEWQRRAEKAEEALRTAEVLLERFAHHDVPTEAEADAYQAALASLSALPVQKEEQERPKYDTPRRPSWMAFQEAAPLPEEDKDGY